MRRDGNFNRRDPRRLRMVAREDGDQQGRACSRANGSACANGVLFFHRSSRRFACFLRACYVHKRTPVPAYPAQPRQTSGVLLFFWVADAHQKQWQKGLLSVLSRGLQPGFLHDVFQLFCHTVQSHLFSWKCVCHGRGNAYDILLAGPCPN